MTTEIHHGPPGSYKSYSLVQRFVIEALRAGRVVVSNIRGLDDIELIRSVYPDIDIPPAADIIFVDTVGQQGRMMMACFYKWVPFGALVVIDEIQQIYPDRRDFRLESLDDFKPHPDDVFDEGIPAEGRPYDVFVAYDKQRHYNWDILASTTNIAKVKRDIREVTDFAYRHRDLSKLLPWWRNTWMEHQHDPENNGKSASHRVGSPKRYSADPRIFKCYSSTATGQHVSNPFKRSIFTDPKLLGFSALLFVCALFFMAVSSSKASKAAGKDSGKPPVAAPAASVGAAAGAQPGTVDSGHGAVPPSPPDSHTPLVLTPELIADWSFSGVPQASLTRLPSLCRAAGASVRCKIENHPNAYRFINAATNHICGSDEFWCIAFFRVIPPEPKEDGHNPNPLSSNLLGIK